MYDIGNFGDTGSRSSIRRKGRTDFAARPFILVRPAGRTHLEVKVLYSPGKGKC